MSVLIEYLRHAEGDVVHYNDGEKDITSPFGIYRFRNRNAEIFKVIDSVAERVGVKRPSKYWSQAEIDVINAAFTDEEKKLMEKLAEEFYNDYMKKTPFHILPNEAKVAFFSMYVNSRLLAIKSAQQTILDIKKNGLLQFDRVSVVDGLYGRKTEECYKVIANERNNRDEFFGYYIETLLLSNMKTQYIRLALANPERYMKYLKGWDNRMNILQRF